MTKSKILRVEKGRTQFKCHVCNTKRMFSVPPGVRTRSLRCSKCGEITRCVFNRRLTLREQQCGTVIVYTGDGRVLNAELYDISDFGVGFDVATRDMNRINVGRDVRFHCSWDPGLLSHGRYVVRSVKGQRVGVERLN